MKNKDKIDFTVHKPHPSKGFPHHTRRCVACMRPFHRKEAVCSFCGTCQRCETITTDKFGNFCFHCQNFIEQPRYDGSGLSAVIHHVPQHQVDDLEPHKPKRQKG